MNVLFLEIPLETPQRQKHPFQFLVGWFFTGPLNCLGTIHASPTARKSNGTWSVVGASKVVLVLEGHNSTKGFRLWPRKRNCASLHSPFCRSRSPVPCCQLSRTAPDLSFSEKLLHLRPSEVVFISSVGSHLQTLV